MELLDFEIETQSDEELLREAEELCLQNCELFVRKLAQAENGEVRGALLLQRNLSEPHRFRVWDTYAHGFEQTALRANDIGCVKVAVCYFTLKTPHPQFCQLFVTKGGLEKLKVALVKEPECRWALNFDAVPVEFFDRVVVTHKQTEDELGVLTRLLSYD